MATKKAAAKKVAKKTAKKVASKRAAGGKSVSLPKEGRDPKGGLTAAGRKAYNEATGGNLKPGVKGAADTPEKRAQEGVVSDEALYNAAGAGGEGRQADAAGAAGGGVGGACAEDRGG